MSLNLGQPLLLAALELRLTEVEPRIVDTGYFNLNFKWLLGARRVFNINYTNTVWQLLKFGGCEAVTAPTTNGIIATEANILRRIVVVTVGCSWPDMMYNLIFLDYAM